MDKLRTGETLTQPAAARRETSPRWFPQALDPLLDRLLLVELAEEDYRAASFLDERSLDPNRPREIVGWADVERSLPEGARTDADYIFHIGHVGSTLLSRLLGEIATVFALREPLVLRTFHDLAMISGAPESPWSPEMFEVRLASLRTLLSRTFRPEQKALVKATSFTSELAPRLVAEGSKALLLYSPPARYFENIFVGEESRRELHALAPSRLKRLAMRSGDAPWKLWDLSEADKAGLAWACEMSALCAAAEALPRDDVKWLDFDSFLAEPAAMLREVAAFFGHEIEPDQARQIASGPLMGLYSKGPQYEYSPVLRAERLAYSRRENARLISDAADWLDQAGARLPGVAAGLQRAKEVG